MPTSTPTKGQTEEDHNPGQDEFDKLIGKNFSPGDERMMEERAKDGAIDDNIGGGSDEQEKIAQHENQLGRGYKKNKNNDTNKKNVSWLIRHRRAVFGGGALSSIIAVIMFFISAGPFEFIHLAHLLEQFHFSTQQDQQDDRFMKEARYLRYASSGEVQKTRLGYLGNKLTDSFEKDLNKSGLQSAYSPRFGYFDGYTIDKNNEQFKKPDGSRMSDAEITKYMQESYGLDAVHGGTIRSSLSGELVINAKGLGPGKTRALNKAVLTKAGYSKVSASVGARLMCKRAGCTLHPLKILDKKVKTALEDWWDRRNKLDQKGQTALDPAQSADQNDKATDAEKSAKAAGDQAVADTKAEAKAAGSDPSKFGGFKSNLSGRILGGPAAAIGVFCMVKSINNDAGEIKRTQVVLPLIRMGTEMMAVGNQLESGQDIDLSEINEHYSKLMSGKDSTGKQSTVFDAQSIQAELGHKKSGVAADGTLKSIGKGVPFDFVNEGPIGAVLGPACSIGGTIVLGTLTLALDFTGVGALVGQVGAGVVTSIASGPILNQIAHWFAGNAVDVTAVGADFGNNVNFGSALAANDQAVAAGGRALTKSEAGTLTAFENSQAQQDFQKHNVAYKLFNRYDEKSAISKLIDNTSPDPPQNIAKMGSMFLNFGHVFARIPNLFASSAHAASAVPYDYGFPTYGFSQDEMNDPTVENPYENACYVVGCHDLALNNAAPSPISSSKHPIIIAAAPAATKKINIAGIFEDTANQQKYTDKAKKCFGVDVVQDSNGRWNVTDSGGDPPNPYDDNYEKKNNCDDTSDTNWTRVRFFIYDTESMTSMACYAGPSDDQDTTQACSDIGFDETNASSGDSSSTGGGPVAQGTSAELAKKLLDYQSSGKYHCDNAGDCRDLQKVVNGQSLAGSDGCQAQTIDPKVLKLLLYMIENGNFKLGTYALCGDHGFDSPRGHSGGFSVDISSVNGVAVNQPNAKAETLKAAKFIHGLSGELKPRQLITAGYGNTIYDDDLLNLEIPSSATFGGKGGTNAEHRNHIHAGY
jgi:hypothetical protein